MPNTYFMWTLEKLQEFWDDHISALFARKNSVYTKAEIDTKTAALEGAMAVVQSTDTATVAISASWFVIWKGSLYVALSAIEIGDTLSSSNLMAVPDGGLNALDASRISGDTALSGRIDSAISGIAIIVDGDTCSVAVPDGGCAYIKKNTHGLTEGLYKNTSGSAFPVSGGSATSSVFTPVPGGIGAEVTLLNGKTTNVTLYGAGQAFSNSTEENVAFNANYTRVEKQEKRVYFRCLIELSASKNGWSKLATLKANLIPAYTVYVVASNIQSSDNRSVYIDTSGNLYVGVTTMSAGLYQVETSYLVAN